MYNGYKNAKITGNFGEKRSYYKPGRFHQGVDLALAMNSPINSLLAGTVLSVKNDPMGYGNYVDIDHGNGVVTRYGHANSFKVKPGQKVKEGEQIGLVGSTGRSSGPHLHVEYLLNGVRKNPMELEKDMANMLKPKGTLGIQDANAIKDLQNQLAMQQIQQEQPADPLRETVAEIIKTKLLNPVEVPKYTTLSDVLNAEKGKGLKTFADFLDNPETMRTIGDFLPKYGYNPETGRMNNVMEDRARKKEALMQAEQERALDEIKAQSTLAKDMYNVYQQKDIADMNDARAREQMQQNAEQFERNLDFQEKQKEADRLFEREENEKNRQNNIKIAKEKGTNGGASFSNITTVRKEFNSIPAIKNYGEIKRQYNNVAAVKKKFENIKGKTKYNANDQTLITTFNKILDPTSVVRESEFARTAAGQGLIDKIQGAANKMVKGGSGLSASERQDVFNAIEAMYQAQEQEAQKYIQFYSELATRYGINPDDIVGGIGLRNISSNTKPKAKAPKGKLVL